MENLRGPLPIVILGAGPAGARAAERLATLGEQVVLLDPRVPWEKPCGGGLTPTLFDELPELEEILPDTRRIDRIRIELSPAEGFSVEMDRPIRIVSRGRLGAWLLSRAVRAGAAHLPLRVKRIRRRAGAWWLETDRGHIAASFLVGADGAASLVRRVAAPTFLVDLAPTRVAYPHGAGPTPDAMVLRFYDAVAGYLWDFPRPDHRSVGIMVPSGTLRRAALDQEVDAYRRSREGAAESDVARAGAVIATGLLDHGDFFHVVGPGYALLGDAAGLADPLTGEGIQNALRSADLLASAWAHRDVNSYRRLVRRTFAAEFAAARLLRRSMLESGLGVGLVRRALTSDAAYATVVAMVNALNAHDAGPRRFARRWLRAVRRARADGSIAARVPRVPAATPTHGVPRRRERVVA
jgi:flavin-dependent dehydrogenase